MKQPILSCFKCGKTPEDILILNCSHNLCLDCAAERISNYSQISNTNLQTLVCETCETPTILDPPTANTLIPRMRKSPQNPTKSIRRISPKMNILQEPPLTISNNPTQYCKNHPSEEVKCFCMDDYAAPICAECVVSGIHRNHNVQNIPNASNIIQEKLNDAVQTMTLKADQLSGTVQSFKKKRITLEELSNKQRNQMKGIFDDLRIKINNKEKEIGLYANQELDQSIREINSLEQQVAGRLQIINNNIDVIQTENIENSPLKLLSFYSNNYETINKLLEIEKMDVLPTSEYFDKYNNSINSDFNKDLKSQIQPIADTLSNLQISPQKYSSGGIVRNPTGPFTQNGLIRIN